MELSRDTWKPFGLERIDSILEDSSPETQSLSKIGVDLALSVSNCSETHHLE